MLETPNAKLIFVLDDDETILSIMKKVLENLGFAVRTFSRPEEFIQNLKNSMPVLCFIDINLGASPGAGFQLTQALRQIFKSELVLIVISSRESPEDIAYALEVGFDDYLIKPINSIIVESKLRQYLHVDIKDNTLLYSLEPTYSFCSFELESYLFSISETEFSILCPHEIPINTVVEFNSGALFDIIKKSISVKIDHRWKSLDSDLHGATFQFPSEDIELKNCVLKWITEKQK